MNLHDNIPSLAMVSNEDGTITLEQYVCGNAERVAVHPVHVRHMAERLGMVPEVSATGAELLRTERGQVAALRQENDRLKRNMLRLHAHALAMQEDFRENADWKHADLSHEMSNINALVGLFDMAVDDFADDYDAHMPVDHVAVTREHATSSPKTDGFEAPPKTDGFETPPKTGALGAGSDVTPCHATSRGSCTPPDPAPPQEKRTARHSHSKPGPLQMDLEGANVR